jgi:hypothetical protein
MKYTLSDLLTLIPIIMIPSIHNYNLIIPFIWIYQSSILYILFKNHYKNRITIYLFQLIYIPSNILIYYFIYQSLNKFLLTSLMINAFSYHYCLYFN